ncbi:MAG: U32 family peptidase C-terminal domain-containing protein [Candidatus Berkelbacteria bacterium]|nr:U32 family peptidase C-terminal domain-containing protein [Candidatus Berkelbacteria bacterium]
MEKEKEEGKLVGEITHFFPHVSAAVLKVKSPLKVGDRIKVVAPGGVEFEQEISSMQIDRNEIEEAKVGDEIGLKVDQKVHEGCKVYIL